jgi:hypothetical protein
MLLHHPMLSSSSVASACHSAGKFSSAVSSLSCCSTSSFDDLTVIFPCVGSSPTSSSCSLGSYSSPSVSKLTYWMCILCTLTLLFRASNSSHRPKSMLFASSSSAYSLTVSTVCPSRFAAKYETQALASIGLLGRNTQIPPIIRTHL